MNSKHLFTISIVAAGLIWGGGHGTASDSGKGMASGGDTSSESANSGVFSGIPDPNAPGGTRDAGKDSEGNMEIGKGRQDQGGQKQDEQVEDKQVHKGMKESELQNAKAIKGEVLRIEGDKYYVVREDGKEVGLRVDGTTQKTGNIHAGDRIEAQANEQNYALSIRSAPTTDRRNEHSPDVLCAGKSLPDRQPGDRVDEEGCK
jgi:hypothetical protein